MSLFRKAAWKFNILSSKVFVDGKVLLVLIFQKLPYTFQHHSLNFDIYKETVFYHLCFFGVNWNLTVIIQILSFRWPCFSDKMATRWIIITLQVNTIMPNYCYLKRSSCVSLFLYRGAIKKRFIDVCR